MSGREGEQRESAPTESQAAGSGSQSRESSAIEEVYGGPSAGGSGKESEKSHSSDKADEGSPDNQLGGFHREYLEDMARSGAIQGSSDIGGKDGAKAAGEDIFGKMPNIYEKKQGVQQEKGTSLGEKASGPYADIVDGAKQGAIAGAKSVEDSGQAGRAYRDMVDRTRAEHPPEDQAGKTYRDMVDRARKADGEKPSEDSDQAGRNYRDMVDRARAEQTEDQAGKTYRDMVDRARQVDRQSSEGEPTGFGGGGGKGSGKSLGRSAESDSQTKPEHMKGTENNRKNSPSETEANPSPKSGQNDAMMEKFKQDEGKWKDLLLGKTKPVDL